MQFRESVSRIRGWRYLWNASWRTRAALRFVHQLIFVLPILLLSIGETFVTSCSFHPRSANEADLFGTGITAVKEGESARIAQIYSGSPADLDGNLHTGDQIIAIKDHGVNRNWVAMRNLSDIQIENMLRGSIGSTVVVKALSKGSDERERTVEVELYRAFTTTNLTGSGFRGHAFAHAGFELFFNPDLTVQSEIIPKLKHVRSARWSKVAIGMGYLDVVRIIGYPLFVTAGRNRGEISWDYGCLVRQGGSTFQFGAANLVFVNGAVSANFSIAEPADDGYQVVILSLPEGAVLTNY